MAKSRRIRTLRCRRRLKSIHRLLTQPTRQNQLRLRKWLRLKLLRPTAAQLTLALPRTALIQLPNKRRRKLMVSEIDTSKQMRHLRLQTQGPVALAWVAIKTPCTNQSYFT